jgi:hypothetical protein
MFQVAMTGELARSAMPSYPMVAGEPSTYHWFYYALAAQLGQGMDTAVVALRLLPVALLLSLALLTGSVARQIAGRSSAAAFGVALVALIGNTVPSGWITRSGIAGRFDADGAALDPIRLYWQHSPTQSLGWLAGVACLGAAIAFLRRGIAKGPVPAIALAAMALLAAGSKSSVPPVLICGLLLVAGLSLTHRDRASLSRAIVAALVVAGMWVVAMLVVYPGGSYGLRVMPGQHVVALVVRLMPAQTSPAADGVFRTTELLPGLVAAAVVLIPLVPRLLGLIWLNAERPLDASRWLATGSVASGFAGTFLTRHPGQSEVFFLVSAYPIGLAGSAAGFALMMERFSRRAGSRKSFAVLGPAAAAGFTITAFIAAWAGVRDPMALWRPKTDPGHWPGGWLSAGEQMLAWSGPHLALAAAVLAVSVLGVLLAARSRSAPWLASSGLGALIMVTALLSGGVVSTTRALAGGSGQSVPDLVRIWENDTTMRRWARTTPELIEAAHVIRNRSSPHDVVATNRVCTQPWALERRCDPRDFTVSAFTGLRTDASGWAYSERAVALAWTTRGGYARVPFWDQQRLQDEQDLVARPTRALADQAWTERGVRWILADRQVGPVATRFDEVGEVVYEHRGVVAVRLRPPTN